MAAEPTATEPGGVPLWSAAAFMLGMLVVWSFLAPVDATSVFGGEAIAQNLMWLVLATVVAAAATVTQLRFRFQQRSWLLACGCLAWLIASSVLAGRQNNPRIAWYGFWQVMSLVACWASVRALLAGPRSQAAILRLVLMGCMALSWHGLYQIRIGFPADRARYLADPDTVIQELGMEAPPGSPARMRFEDRLLHSSEPYATFALANSLATLLSGGLLLLLGLALHFPLRDPTGQTSNGQRLRWVVLGVAAVVVGVCWFLTRSKTAYVAVLAGIAFGLLQGTLARRLTRAQIMAVLGFAGLGLAVGGLWLMQNDTLVISEAPKSLAYRLEYWIATLDMLRDHGLFGVGLGNFQNYYPYYKLPLASEEIADPHNWILDVVTTLSVPVGMVLVSWIGVRVFVPAAATQMSAAPSPAGEMFADDMDRVIARRITTGALIGGLACGGALYFLSGLDFPVIAMAWAIAGLTGLGLQSPDLLADEPRRSVSRSAAFTMIVCLLASGSWQASGLAVPLLLLLQIGSPVQLKAGWRSAMEKPSQSPWKSWAICGLPALGVIIFMLQCWRPVTSSWTLMQQAATARDPAQQQRLAEAAAAADSLDTEPLGWLAQLQAQHASQSSDVDFERLAQASLAAFDDWLAADAIKPINWEIAGRAALELAASAQHRNLAPARWVDAASGYFTQAANRYPTSIGLRAQLAVTLAMAGRTVESRNQLATAAELSERTPHADKKLANHLLWLPILPAGAEAEFGEASPWIPAEPMLNWMRKEELDR